MREINKDFDGKDCWECVALIRQEKTQKDIDEEHNKCHGWVHCGDECCGSCNVCGI